MQGLTRLIISNERLKLSINNILELTNKESHYLYKVMRTSINDEILITDGLGSLWNARIIKDNFVELVNFKKPLLSKKPQSLRLGLATSIPKNGFEDILKMSTEIGIDFIQPLITDRQIKRINNLSAKELRWDFILNESVEQCERLWKPKLLQCLTISKWIPTVIEKDFITISVTRSKNPKSLGKLLREIELNSKKKDKIFWNVIGPEGGWSQNEIRSFIEYKIQLVKLSENILRTSTAAINASFIMDNWRSENIGLNDF